MSDSEQPGQSTQPKQVDSPNYHNENHTAAQTCGWTANALRGEGTCDHVLNSLASRKLPSSKSTEEDRL